MKLALITGMKATIWIILNLDRQHQTLKPLIFMTLPLRTFHFTTLPLKKSPSMKKVESSFGEGLAGVPPSRAFNTEPFEPSPLSGGASLRKTKSTASKVSFAVDKGDEGVSDAANSSVSSVATADDEIDEANTRDVNGK
jgi:hypothetical protein